MDNQVVIYCDDKMSIALDSTIMHIIEKTCSNSPMFKLSEDDMRFLLNICFSTLFTQGIKPNKPIISSTIPLISFSKFEKMMPPFEEMSWVMYLLAEKAVIHTPDVIQELQEQVNGQKEDGLYYLHIFPLPIRNTSGFIYAEYQDKSLLLLFAHDEMFLL